MNTQAAINEMQRRMDFQRGLISAAATVGGGMARNYMQND